MVPLESLTYVCWIQFFKNKVMLFAYVSGHTEHLLLLVYVSEPMNPLYIYVERNFPCNTV